MLCGQSETCAFYSTVTVSSFKLFFCPNRVMLNILYTFRRCAVLVNNLSLSPRVLVAHNTCSCCRYTCNELHDVQYVTSYSLLHALLLAETCDEGSSNLFGGLINEYIWSFDV